jgi:asparagine synthetase B (glutamine-hydrolysing)
LGHCRLFNTSEAVHERLPHATADRRLVITAEARLDNRDELCDLFGISHADRASMPDGELIRRAYERWGEACPDHLLGDWSFAVWHPRERRLFLARDHHGNIALYYLHDGRRFAFASDRKALLALPDVPQRLNELYLAQVLVAWTAYHGPDTIYLDIHRLPPAHAMTVTPEVACPELPASAGQPEVHIRYRPVPAHLDQPKATGVLFEAAAGCFLLCIEGVGRFLVREGCEIAIDRAPHATDGEVRLFLLGYAFGA